MINRPFKFRAWDGNAFHQWGFDGSTFISPTQTTYKASYEMTHQQYIGTTDQNGIEIYEGDIIRVKNEWNETSVHQVKWSGEDYPAFDLIPEVSDELNSLAEIICGQYEYEVIGNIYQNAELLEAK